MLIGSVHIWPLSILLSRSLLSLLLLLTKMLVSPQNCTSTKTIMQIASERTKEKESVYGISSLCVQKTRFSFLVLGKLMCIKACNINILSILIFLFSVVVTFSLCATEWSAPKTQYLHGQSKTAVQRLYKYRFQWKHISEYNIAATYEHIEGRMERVRTHSENVISMHADNNYRMMEMRKTLNQIKATTKRKESKRLNPRKIGKKAIAHNVTRWECVYVFVCFCVRMVKKEERSVWRMYGGKLLQISNSIWGVYDPICIQQLAMVFHTRCRGWVVGWKTGFEYLDIWCIR